MHAHTAQPVTLDRIIAELGEPHPDGVIVRASCRDLARLYDRSPSTIRQAIRRAGARISQGRGWFVVSTSDPPACLDDVADVQDDESLFETIGRAVVARLAARSGAARSSRKKDQSAVVVNRTGLPTTEPRGEARDEATSTRTEVTALIAPLVDACTTRGLVGVVDADRLVAKVAHLDDASIAALAAHVVARLDAGERIERPVGYLAAVAQAWDGVTPLPSPRPSCPDPAARRVVTPPLVTHEEHTIDRGAQLAGVAAARATLHRRQEHVN